MCSSLEKHVPSLNKSFLHELEAELCSLPGFSTASQKDTTFFILNRHEIGRDLDVDYVRAIAMGAEVVHEQVVSVVYEEVQGIEHVSVVFQNGHLQGGFDYLFYLIFSLLFVVNEFDTLLLVLLSQQIRCLLDKSFRSFQLLLEFINLREERHVVLGVKLAFLQGKKLFAVIRSLCDLFGPLLDVDNVSIFNELVKLVKLLLLHGLYL